MPAGENLRGYVFRTVHNLAVDDARKERKLVPFPDEELLRGGAPLPPLNESRFRRAEVEDTLERTELRETAARLVMYLPNERDRRLGLLRWRFDFTAEEIHCHTGWPVEQIEAGLKRVLRALSNMAKMTSDGAPSISPSPWEEVVALPGGRPGPFSVAFINTYLPSIVPDCSQSILKTFDVKTPTELYEEYACILRAEDVNTLEPRLFYSFMRRRDFQSGAYSGEGASTYVDLVPSLERIKVKSKRDGWMLALSLTQRGGEYQTWRIRREYDDRARVLVHTWHVPAVQIAARKIFTESIFSFMYYPLIREQGGCVYQLFPIEHT